MSFAEANRSNSYDQINVLSSRRNWHGTWPLSVVRVYYIVPGHSWESEQFERIWKSLCSQRRYTVFASLDVNLANLCAHILQYPEGSIHPPWSRKRIRTSTCSTVLKTQFPDGLESLEAFKHLSWWWIMDSPSSALQARGPCQPRWMRALSIQ